jgi:hypothetical protein
VLKYLAKIASLRITYSGNGDTTIVGYTDADYVADESRKSIMGYIFTYAGGPITWSSKLQRSVSTSTIEAEYHALAYTGKEAVWIRSMLDQLYQSRYTDKPTLIYRDNQGAITLVKNPEFHARTKHIDVSAHYVRELVEDHKISLVYIQTDEMLADMLTKPLRKVRHLQNVQQVGLR